MCAICLKIPCASGCPNASEPKPVYICKWCEEAINEGDEYMETSDGEVCKECIKEMSIIDFMEMVGEKFEVAEREEI